MKLKLHGRRPQCQHRSEKEADKGNGRCSRCAMPCAPLNNIRFWSPFMHNVSNFSVDLTPANAPLVDAFIQSPQYTVPHTIAA
jgi:hypothetical protein